MFCDSKFEDEEVRFRKLFYRLILLFFVVLLSLCLDGSVIEMRRFFKNIESECEEICGLIDVDKVEIKRFIEEYVFFGRFYNSNFDCFLRLCMSFVILSWSFVGVLFFVVRMVYLEVR